VVIVTGVTSPTRASAGVPPSTRRAALGAALAGGGLLAWSACAGPAGTPDGTPAGAGSEVEPPEDDRALLDAARVELLGLVDVVAATRARHRTLRGPLRSVEDAHRAAVEELDGDLAPLEGLPSPGVPRRPDAALRRVRERQQRARRRLLNAGLEARSGALARLLVAASAGVAQQGLLLPVDAGGGT